ncbi:hypothetical protein AJ78_06486 [Emergomyces pasteurianus Ep9510]|uniref:Uncharacterized protein n=1 Tax=Emergomyces pasteurianus Ep9510 TaxID=1447872 RepID=A0A1J9P8Q5_9EURO|nr:hypothetical protein AJ78_06486 [Emergomyces pasteurianus Ep9510]
MTMRPQYAYLNSTQCGCCCHVPTRFQIAVNIGNKAITVTPQTVVLLRDIDSDGWIANRAGGTLAALSPVSTIPYTFLLADTFSSNVFNVNQFRAEPIKEKMHTHAMAKTFQALSDQHPFSLEGALLVIAKDVKTPCNS